MKLTQELFQKFKDNIFTKRMPDISEEIRRKFNIPDTHEYSITTAPQEKAGEITVRRKSKTVHV